MQICAQCPNRLGIIDSNGPYKHAMGFRYKIVKGVQARGYGFTPAIDPETGKPSYREETKDGYRYTAQPAPLCMGIGCSGAGRK